MPGETQTLPSDREIMDRCFSRVDFLPDQHEEQVEAAIQAGRMSQVGGVAPGAFFWQGQTAYSFAFSRPEAREKLESRSIVKSVTAASIIELQARPGCRTASTYLCQLGFRLPD